jgi:hypothetical protein
MSTKKKKINIKSKYRNIKNDKNCGIRNDENYRDDKCPKNIKDCLHCKVLDCPEER